MSEWIGRSRVADGRLLQVSVGRLAFLLALRPLRVVCRTSRCLLHVVCCGMLQFGIKVAAETGRLVKLARAGDPLAKPSPGANVCVCGGGFSPVPVQMWAGEPSPGADVGGRSLAESISAPQHSGTRRYSQTAQLKSVAPLTQPQAYNKYIYMVAPLTQPQAYNKYIYGCTTHAAAGLSAQTDRPWRALVLVVIVVALHRVSSARLGLARSDDRRQRSIDCAHCASLLRSLTRRCPTLAE